MLALTIWCLSLSIVDIAERRLPNVLTVPGALAVVGYGSALGQVRAAVVGGSILAVAYLLLHVMAPHSLGAGDVKLAVGLGAAAALGGPDCWVLAALLAPIGTAAAGVIVLIRRGDEGRRAGIAHGPSMCAATLVALCSYG
ncbi:prepilin peptidase [Antrihabitans cavernicola]|uniref:Prepilin peptidase n=1 Tax=Antrihabitans cavernicola TaxID=2495913 RepID=A0A5A7SCS3_9NOCA|nr:A24 family peptidase [Spelaeibacter cavernicola]KAA0023696.1 prepilin peptidase [Spelaeibacter cavernicola]